MKRDRLDKTIMRSGIYVSVTKWVFRVAGIILLAGLICHYLCQSNALDMLLIAGFSLMSLMLFLRAYENSDYAPEDADSKAEAGTDSREQSFWTSPAFVSFARKMFFLGLAVLFIALLFLVFAWPGYKTMLVCSLPCVLIGLVLTMISKNKWDRGL